MTEPSPTEHVHRLFWAIDARRWDVAEAACAPEGPLVPEMRASLAGVATHHQCTNPCVTLDGPAAAVEVYVTARYRRATLRGGDSLTRMSHDRIQLRRTDARWLVTGLQRTVLMTEGNPGVLAATGDEQPPVPTAPLPPEPPARNEAERLDRIADHQAIHDLMMRFGRGLDAKDWTLYRSCFAAEVSIDFAQSTGHAPRRVSADGFVDYARLRQRKHASFHQYSNFQASVDGDRARCILYMAARHRMSEATGDPLNVFVGWYDNEFVRTPDGWRISALRHPLQWVEGNAAIKDAPDPEAEALGRQLFETAKAA